jgi:hypothetical protein
MRRLRNVLSKEVASSTDLQYGIKHAVAHLTYVECPNEKPDLPQVQVNESGLSVHSAKLGRFEAIDVGTSHRHPTR